ncbi:Hypothetical protein PP7435_CHR2-2034 [Komagataella phaffii CBS 7435]|uniref:Uncharacterized protein n=1 Tax=Komagataella phaffii (strain ATCC 76273 / CBS 7435 / CECT 11047 / NRRL Y-11430 / Wegner 21-1) TaxID=981350 RepID=A0A1G4KPU8_KOMPC|nr:Hypothetical protein PP7435_CHR2-2034 [Komagataella phaffii CBS 7435]
MKSIYLYIHNKTAVVKAGTTLTLDHKLVFNEDRKLGYEKHFALLFTPQQIVWELQ